MLWLCVVFVCCLFCFRSFFFFFKQKTAYEMRISDWSSDVCSSDLDGGTLVARLCEVALLDQQLIVALQGGDLDVIATAAAADDHSAARQDASILGVNIGNLQLKG